MFTSLTENTPNRAFTAPVGVFFRTTAVLLNFAKEKRSGRPKDEQSPMRRRPVMAQESGHLFRCRKVSTEKA